VPSLRARFLLYLACVHLIAGGLGVYLLLQHRAWLFAVEFVLVASFVAGTALIRRLFRALTFVGDSAQFLNDSDYTARFLDVGQPEIDRLIAVYNRMVDHLRAERQRVQEQHYFLGRILEASPSGILVLDFDDRLDVVNPAASRLLQRRGDELAGRRLDDLEGALPAALATLGPGESRVVALHGGRRVRVRHGRFIDRGFARRFFLLEELTEELRQSEKAAYEKLIRMMSHEVNNSVAASRSLLESSLAYASQLRDADRADFERALRIAIDRMGHLNAFMRSFADVVRLPAPVAQPTNLLLLLEHVEELTRAERQSRRIGWTLDITPGIEPVPLDRVQFEQALVNIVRNAIDAVDRDGSITIRIGRENGRLRLAVEDSGPGIPDAVRDQLFTPFFTTKQNGQGIGLTVVQEILANHHFDYSLESPPGGPTRFIVLF
jgi:two-component system, NtrC family, nitrogen regulation sensor histidine kinase NtrY